MYISVEDKFYERETASVVFSQIEDCELEVHYIFGKYILPNRNGTMDV